MVVITMNYGLLPFRDYPIFKPRYLQQPRRQHAVTPHLCRQAAEKVGYHSI